MEPKSVGAGEGLTWFGCGWNLFKADWAIWIGIFVVFALIAVGLWLIPFLGSLVLTIIVPALTGGAMYAASVSASGERVKLEHAFQGFSETAPRSRLLTLGLILLAAHVALLLLALVLFGAGALLANQATEAVALHPEALGAGALLGVLVVVSLSLLVVMLFYYAPPLVMLRGLTPRDALVASFSACMRNILPILVFQLVLLVLFFIATIPLGLGLLVLMPLGLCAFYCSFDAIFPAPAAARQGQAPPLLR
jgi:uncharacterized membrane protein